MQVTGMLASVTSLEEALLAEQAGVDIIDLKDPRNGALGELDGVVIDGIARELSGKVTLSATIGDLPYQPAVISAAVMETAARGVDLVKIGVFGDIRQREMLQTLNGLARRDIAMVLVCFAESWQPDLDYTLIAEAGVRGVMLDTRDKRTGALRDKLQQRELAGFVLEVQRAGLMAGLAGSLALRDIAPLLELGPDYLGFRGALCRGSERSGGVEREALFRVRGAIPRRQAVEIAV